MNTVTVLLLFNYIDRSCAMGVEKKMFYASNPNSGIRADVCIVVLVRLEHIVDAYVDFLIVTLLFASVHVCVIFELQAVHDRPYTYSYARLVPQLTYDLHRTSGFGRCQFILFSGHGFYNGGPLAGVKEIISK
jgi:hypothetical protein